MDILLKEPDNVVYISRIMHKTPPGQKVIIIVGPTASGKSDLAIKIAKKIGGEIISADSRQVYRGMDIGTGKVTRDKVGILDSRLKDKSKIKNLKSKIYYSGGIIHHLIDVADPKKQFTASDFKKRGEKAIKGISAKNKIPVIVGGTGFYIDILLGRMQAVEVKPNKKLRAELEKQSTEQLFRRLQGLDPAFSKVIDRHNRRRLTRALEIVITTGKPVPKPVLSSKYYVLWLGINPGKKELTERIKKRLDERLRKGMTSEIRKLRESGVSWKKLDDFGLEYRWLSRWLKNSRFKIPDSRFKKSEEYQNLLRDIIRYSKRQMTWFKKNKEISWIKNEREVNKKITAFLSR